MFFCGQLHVLLLLIVSAPAAVAAAMRNAKIQSILLILHSVIRNQGYTNYRSTTQFEPEALLSSNTKVVYNNFELQ